MSLHDFDADLAQITKDIDALFAERAQKKLAGLRPLVARRVAIVESQLRLERHFERIKRLGDREHLLLPREKALLHWGKIYLAAAEHHYSVRSRLLVRALWLTLVKTRLGGEGGEGEPGDADDLVTLAVRQTNLAKTETYLATTLDSLKEKQRDLSRRYESLGIKAANLAAASSLASRLGVSPLHALESPQIKAIERVFQRIVAPLAPKGPPQRTAERLSGRAEGLLAVCRNMILSRLKDPLARPTPRAMDRFENALAHLGDLEADTRRAYELLVESVPELPRPRLIPTIQEL